jgi:hypothetical protein
MRTIPLSALIATRRRESARHGASAAEIMELLNEPSQAKIWQTFSDRLTRGDPPRGRKPLYGLEHFSAVAAVYIEAEVKPTQAVANHWKVSKSAAAKWIARCRELGLLPKTTRGVMKAVTPEPSGPMPSKRGKTRR